jgi:hypothetical protein
MIAGRQFFADPSVVGRPLIVGDHGIFVREDLALARNLRTPTGAFKPSVVKFLANPPAIRAEPHWDAEPVSKRAEGSSGSVPAIGWRRVAAAMGKLLRRQEM